MNLSFRTTLTLFAALSASQVAPAQVTHEAEPLIAQGSNVIPAVVVLQPIAPATETTPTFTDPLAPAAEPEVAPEPTPEDEDDAPTVSRAASLESKVAALRGTDPGSRELECLAVGIYFEAKSESLAGQLAVGHVIADRAASGRFASSYCGVLFQRGQFSFIRGKSWPAVARSGRQWQNAVAIARIVDQDMHESPVAKALFFHAKRVSPGWRLKRVGSVGNHVFYR
ncbi:cell wall hydrolase [Sphingomonas mesophila]|uniref:cell wall hydrolase n=1 Tax=Sphingomonas mesophila TaxID=2303576 RepID=UPI000E56B9DD|nr:cell wall hydrolase [Sphingomonas mesophila]